MKQYYFDSSADVWMGHLPWVFLGQVMIKSMIMFVVVLIFMRILGKRGIMQLSVFELVILLILGSAAGDPMLYQSVGVLPACMVLLTVVILYRVVIYFLSKNRKFEVIIKGDPQYLVVNGKICVKEFKKQPLALAEFYAELRLQNVSQLGQVKYAIIETSGDISLFFYADEDVKCGLSIMPHSFKELKKSINVPGNYSCIHCGHTAFTNETAPYTCPECKEHTCTVSSNELRIS